MTKHKYHYFKQIVKQSLANILDSKKKRFGIAAICIVMLTILITGMYIARSLPQNNEPSVSNGSEDVQGPVQAEIDWQALAAAYNPPKIDGLLRAIADSAIAADGSIAITADIKREFNQMGTDYRFFYMPTVVWYDFESTGTALSYMLFTWTGKFGTFPKHAPKYEAEARLRKVFAAPNNEYPQLEHQTYTKMVVFDGEAYTLWPESYNDSTIIYDLVDLRVRQEGAYAYYTASANEYQFDLSGIYEPGKNENFLSAKAKALGLDYATTLAKLLENGEISAAFKSRTYTIEFRIEGDNTIPMIVSVNKQYI